MVPSNSLLLTPDYEQSFSAGQLLFLEGDECTHVGCVLSGEVVIRSIGPDGREFIIQTLKPGNYFGDVLLFAHANRHYLGNVTALVETRIAFYTPDSFVRLLQSSKEGLIAYLQQLAEKTYELKQDLKLLGQPSLRDRILFYLFSEAEKQGSKTVELSLNQEELSEKMHVARPSLSREFSQLKKDGFIDYKRRKIRILK